ncbi:MAG: hypothetical protein M3Y27_08080 [Acidobacteriota bacterium]|nr:hypothetical protein [Acidobacteriota bacterium]
MALIYGLIAATLQVAEVGPFSLMRTSLLLVRQKAALQQAVGTWKDKDHPELKNGAKAWVRKLRKESEARFRKQFRNG